MQCLMHIVYAQHKQVEQEEEYITNKLMKRLEQLKKEKQLLATEVCFGNRHGYPQAQDWKQLTLLHGCSGRAGGGVSYKYTS